MACTPQSSFLMRIANRIQGTHRCPSISVRVHYGGRKCIHDVCMHYGLSCRAVSLVGCGISFLFLHVCQGPMSRNGRPSECVLNVAICASIVQQLKRSD